MTKINHDQLFKELLTTFFVEFLELFFPNVLEYLDTDTISFIDKELFTDTVRGEKKTMDIVALAKFQQQNYSFLVHIENESSSNTNFNQRPFRYFCTLFLVLVRACPRMGVPLPRNRSWVNAFRRPKGYTFGHCTLVV